MTQRSRAGSTKPRSRTAPAAKRRRRVETTRGVTSSASKEELRSELLRRKLSEARRQQRRTEEALRESERQLRQIIDTVPSFLWSADPTGEPTYVNQRALDYSGMRFEEFKHGGWEAFIHPADFPGTMKAFGHAIETGTSYETVHRLRRCDGEYRWHQARGDPLRDRDGRIIQWYGLAIDIDDAKKAEDRLRRSEAYLAEAQRLTHTATAAYNATEILYFSDEAFRLFGFDPLRGLPSREAVWQRVHPDDVDTVNEKVERALRERRSFQNEFRLKLPDGTVKHVDADIMPVFSATGELVEIIATAVDVTERKRAEDTLRRGEAWLAQAQRLSHTGTWVLDGTTKHFLYWSDESYHIWGVDPLQGLPSQDDMWERVHPDDRERVWGEVQEALREKRDFLAEFKILLPDGTVKHLEGNTHHEFSPLGALLEVICTNVDVTERKRAEDTLRRSESWLSQAQRLNHTGTWVLDGTTKRFLYWSDESYRIWGFDPLKGLPTRDALWERIHPDDRERVWAEVQEALREQRDFFDEFKILLPDGTVKYLESNTHHEFSPLGALFEVVSTSVDITERKQAEDTLRRGEAWLAQAQKLSHTGTWVLDGTTRRYLYWSDESYRIWGFDPLKGLPGRDETWERIHPDDRERVWGEVQEALREQRDLLSEFKILLPDGTVKYVEINGHHEFSPCGALLEAIITNVDVTDRKRAQDEREQLRQLEADLAHINRVSMMGEMAASLSHEILHPIATARNNARAGMRFLEMNPPNLDEAREALGCVVKDADRAKDIVGRIRNQIKRAPPRKMRFCLNEAVNEVIVMVQSAITKSGTSFSTRLMDGLVPVQGDRVQLQQVLVNLILNAVEAMSSIEDGTRELSIRTEQSQSGGILVAVHDSGPGVDPVNLERVFEPFYTTKTSGIGMGLSICQTIINGHGGRLWMSANEPRGSVFQFTLPAAQQDP